MKNFLKLTALLVCTALIAHSQPGKPTTGATVPPPCLSITQRVRLGDSMAMLPRVRRAAVEYRTAATLAMRTRDEAETKLATQQGMTNAMVVESQRWKGKARRRGLLNWLYTTLIISAGYVALK